MSDARPNIVLMVADDHGLDAGCYSHQAIETPHLDALAADGVTFTHGFCTTASCAASRTVILTGTHGHTNGAYGHTHGRHHFMCFDDVVSLPVLLSQAGYHTARIGKYHVAPARLFPFDTVLPACGRDDVQMAERCRPVVEGDEPFFLYWCSFNPHRDGRVLDHHPCQPDRFGNPDDPFPGDQETTFADADVVVPSYLPDTPETRAELAQYYQSVARLDRGIGRLIQILQDAGKYDNTVILYISDNGAAFPVAKTTVYEPGMHLPLLVRSPLHRSRGTSCDGLVTWADITPTTLDFAGALEDRDRFFGDSFKGIIDQPSPSDWRGEVYASHSFHEITNYYPMRVVRTHRHKFIWNIAHQLDYSFASDLYRSATWQGALRDGLERFGARTIDAYVHRPRFELYDLQADPDETRNLADDPAHADLVQAFCEKLRAFQEQTHDPWLHKWEYE
ncbi:MAG: sulfatase [Planctomycetota bacterium]